MVYNPVIKLFEKLINKNDFKLKKISTVSTA